MTATQNKLIPFFLISSHFSFMASAAIKIGKVNSTKLSNSEELILMSFTSNNMNIITIDIIVIGDGIL